MARPRRGFFTGLEKVELGEVFYLHVLDQTLAYEVDQILVVKPYETEELRPAYGKDYATLVTCTLYRTNSHRLFVRGHRVEYSKEVHAEQAEYTADASTCPGSISYPVLPSRCARRQCPLPC